VAGDWNLVRAAPAEVYGGTHHDDPRPASSLPQRGSL